MQIIKINKNMAGKSKYIHSIAKINITPNIRTNCIIIIYTLKQNPRNRNHNF
jgi:hypothetical protein